MSGILKIIGLLALSATKFFFTPGVMTLAGYSFWQTILISTLGGWLGIVLFYYFAFFIFKKLKIRKERRIRQGKIRQKKMFSRKNKFIVRVKSNYGLIGLALITPVLISIPIGSLLAARYFNKNPFTLPVLLSSVVLWSFALTSLSYLIRF